MRPHKAAGSQLRNKRGMRGQLGLRKAWRKRRLPAHDSHGGGRVVRRQIEHELRSLAVRKMRIDFGEKLSVEQRAMLVARAPGHSEMLAKTVERLPHARQLAAGQLQGIDDARKWIVAAQRQFNVQEAEIKSSVMSHQRGGSVEDDELIGALGEHRRRAHLLIGQTMNGYSLGGHRLARIEVRVPCRAGRLSVQKLHTPDFNNSVPIAEIEPSGFGVDDNFPHECLPRTSYAALTVYVTGTHPCGVSRMRSFARRIAIPVCQDPPRGARPSRSASAAVSTGPSLTIAASISFVGVGSASIIRSRSSASLRGVAGVSSPK